MFRNFHKKIREKFFSGQDTSMTAFIKQASQSGDFIRTYHSQAPTPFWISYFESIVDEKILHEHILASMKERTFDSLRRLQAILPIEEVLITKDIDEVQGKLHDGYVMIQRHEHDATCALIRASEIKSRQIEPSEVEFSVIGPKQAFVEKLDTNLNMLRHRLPLPQLVFKELQVGKLSKTRVIVAYIDGIANEENVNTMVQRLDDIEFDVIIDSSFLQQMINDNSNSPFPQYLTTEKPDRVASLLAEGKVAVLCEGASQAFAAPHSYFESFVSSEDYYIPWVLGSAFRLIRFFAIFFSVVASPLYIAVLTYHYPMIPEDMLETLVASRAKIPFPPVVEVIFMELTIELLREAGARLPSKVGQTLGIVGGIVIGQAAVQAGMTSNVLLIIVALSALSSFTTPVYKMANTVRLIRFPFILLAAALGGIGVLFCFTFFIIHLLRLTSLGRPYFKPLYPPRLRDFKDSFIRSSINQLYKRPVHMQPGDVLRFNPKRAKMKKDIDE